MFARRFHCCHTVLYCATRLLIGAMTEQKSKFRRTGYVSNTPFLLRDALRLLHALAAHPSQVAIVCLLQVWHELFMWHNAGNAVGWHPAGFAPGKGLYNQPGLEHCENEQTKRRIHNLVAACGMLEHLTPIATRLATEDEITRWVRVVCARAAKNDSLLIPYGLELNSLARPGSTRATTSPRSRS